MTTSIVFTFIGADKPGLIEQISLTVSSHDGNWLESRMSQLAGQFAGIARISIDDTKANKLIDALQKLSNKDLTLTVTQGNASTLAIATQQRQLSIVGYDRAGIVREVSSALASRRINVCEMSSNITSAPMTGESMFEANATIEVPLTLDIGELIDKLDDIASDLTIDIHLDD